MDECKTRVECKTCTECYICREALNEPCGFHLELVNSNKHFAKCVKCTKDKYKISIFHTVVEQFPRLYTCDCCKTPIIEKSSIINGLLFLCGKCMDATESIEYINMFVNNWLM